MMMSGGSQTIAPTQTKRIEGVSAAEMEAATAAAEAAADLGNSVFAAFSRCRSSQAARRT